MKEVIVNWFVFCVIVAAFLLVAYWAFSHLFDYLYPDADVEQERLKRDMEERLAEANRKAIKRQRLSAVKFWNF